MHEWNNILHELEQENAVTLMRLQRSNNFHVPASYFSDNIAACANIVQQQQTDNNSEIIPALRSAKNFQVPPLYFDNLAQQVLQKAQQTEKESEQTARHLQQYTAAASSALKVPQGYFESLPQMVLAKAAALADAEDVELPQVCKENAFGVPSGYFQQLPQQILEKLPKEQQAAKVISMPQAAPVRRLQGWRSAMAVAAVLLVFLVSGYFLRQNMIQPAAVSAFNVDAALAELNDEQFNYLLQTNLTEEDLPQLAQQSNLNVFSFYEADDLENFAKSL